MHFITRAPIRGILGLNTTLMASIPRFGARTIISPLRLGIRSRYYSEEMKSKEYIPEGKIVTDPVTGEKKFVKPMTIHSNLPEDPHIKERKTGRIAFSIFALFILVATASVFQYEKVSTPVMNATMYYLRRSQLARSHLGNEITYSGWFPYISGEVNTVKGVVNIHTKVEGKKGKAVMYLKAGRASKDNDFHIDVWKLVQDDGVVLDLLHDDDSIVLEI